ncbi:MAG: DUF2207 domain-containing protein [Patescibacteria group bacterium]|jgi:uncharacterized membrane protein
MKKLLLTFIFASVAALFPGITLARDTSQITDWYIKDFRSEIVVNKDSSLDITETITADCGKLPDKHGIFRMLPTYYQKTASQKIDTPIDLKSITDSSGKAIQYSTTKKDGSITWKIGDPDIAVTGTNIYKINYLVKNTIRFDSTNFDEFYWNLNGNFWQIETDSFTAKIKFPAEISKSTAKEINLYSGNLGIKDAGLATYSWTDTNTIEVKSSKTLGVTEGITLSATFPKSIIAPYTPTFLEKYGGPLTFLIPLFVLFYMIRVWGRSGKDPKGAGAVMAEYEAPDNLAPIELSVLEKNGQMRNQAITAAIINLAVKGFLKIEQIEKKGLFGQKDFKLIKLEGKSALSTSEKDLLPFLFAGKSEVLISELKDKFYSNIPRLKKTALDDLNAQGYFDPNGFKWKAGLLVGGFIIGFSGFWLLAVDILLGFNIIVAGLIVFVFAFLMPRRTAKGAETHHKILGFKEFINKTEKYRANFNEKENIFEKFLPYAILFGLTGVWINNMKKIYDEDYFMNYHPIWFYGPMFTNFNANTFNDMVTDLSNNMNSAISSSPSSSGAGGGGFSGGGGGGGGGGGW